MKPLFLRVFALLLASFLVVMVISFLVFRWVNQELEPGVERLQEMASETASDLVDSHRRGAFDEARNRLRRHRVRAWIEDDQGRPLHPPPVPPEIRRQVRGFPQVVYPFQNRDGRYFIFSQAVTREDRTYHVILTSGRNGFRDRNRWGFFWVPLAAMAAGLLAAGAALSYWMLRPLRTFSIAARSISAENLDSRLPPRITNRRDAFGDLAREFNGMTDRLERSVENQNQLLRDVSHELRSPLARIQVAASLWARKSDNPEAYERIETEVGRLDRLVGDLLSLTRIRSGYHLSPTRFDLGRMLKRIADDAAFEFSPEDKQVALNAPSGATCLGDEGLVTSAVENVVRNALRHSRRGDCVDITLVAAKGSYRLTIRDRGPGVEESSLERIFEPFYQADEARNVDSGHHGIGLSLARAIVTLHGGNIRADNAEDGGLVITIDLPVSGGVDAR